MRPSCTASVALAISTSLRAAVSGSANWLGVTNFMGSLCGGDMGDMDQDFVGPMAVKGFAAGAAHDAARPLRRHPLASLPDRIFPRSPVALIPPFLKIGL